MMTKAIAEFAKFLAEFANFLVEKDVDILI